MTDDRRTTDRRDDDGSGSADREGPVARAVDAVGTGPTATTGSDRSADRDRNPDGDGDGDAGGGGSGVDAAAGDRRDGPGTDRTADTGADDADDTRSPDADDARSGRADRPRAETPAGPARAATRTRTGDDGPGRDGPAAPASGPGPGDREPAAAADGTTGAADGPGPSPPGAEAPAGDGLAPAPVPDRDPDLVDARRRGIAARLATYDRVVEVGVGRRHGVAAALAGRGVEVVATDVTDRSVPEDVEFVRDDVTDPDLGVYRGADAMYALNCPPELHGVCLRVARRVGADFLFTTLGTDPPAVSATPEQVPGDTLYRARPDAPAGGPD